MDFEALFAGLAVRHATDSARDMARFSVEKIITSPKRVEKTPFLWPQRRPFPTGAMR